VSSAVRRVFVPLGPAALRRLDAEGRLPPPGRGHAVTDRLREAVPGADEDDLEYTALCDAADASVGAGPGWRLVAAADVAAAGVLASVPDGGRAPSTESLVWLSEPLDLAHVASFHVGEPGAADDEELSWYDVSELPVILASLG